MRYETVDYEVLSHFIPAIINADDSGLTDYELEELHEFMIEAESFAKKRPGYRSHHWSMADDSHAGFGQCEITACFGERETLQLVIMYAPEERS